MLALIRDDAIVFTVHPGGWFDLPDGSRASPAQDGWTDGIHSLAEIQPADSVPEGKQVASTSVEMVDGQPRYVRVLEDLPPPPVPDRVSSRQFKLQLAIDGLKPTVDAWVAAQDELTQIAYEYSGEFVRGEPMMQAGFAALGSTPEQGDAFFVAAAGL